MFAENNRISWSQMHCQCLLAALGMGLIWGIPEFIGREGAVGILIGGILLVLWSGILRRQMTVFRDPIRYLGKVPAWLIAGIWESYLVLTGGWLVGKVGHLAGEYLVSGVPETLLSLIFCSCGTGRIPSCTGTGAAGANLMGGCSMAGRDLAVAGCSSKQYFSGDGVGRSTSGNNRV